MALERRPGAGLLEELLHPLGELLRCELRGLELALGIERLSITPAAVLPIKAMVEAMRAAGVPAEVSNSAGTYER